MTQDGQPTNVIEAIAAVMRDLPGIGKDNQASEKQGGYSYRGIEAITAEIQRLLGKYGVVFVLREEEAHIVDIKVNGNPWTDNFLTVYYDVFGPGGLDDKVTVGPIHVQGRDNSDKGYNKARTQAFKYALLQTFSIGDSKDDADGTAHERSEPNAAPPEPPTPQIAMGIRIKSLPEAERNKVKEFVANNNLPSIPNEWTDDHLETIGRKVDALEEIIAKDASAPETPTPQEAPPATDAGVGDEPTGADESPASLPPADEPTWDRDSLLAGIKAYEERLDDKTFPVYTGWLAEVFGNDSSDITKFDGADLEQVWQKLDELTTEGVPA